MYVQDFDERFHWARGSGGRSQERWFRDLYPYVKNLDVYVCPNMTEDRDYGGIYFRPGRCIQLPDFPMATRRAIAHKRPAGYEP